MAKGEKAEAGAFEGADLSLLRIEDSPEWREMQARGERLAADLKEAEDDLEAARNAWREETGEIERSALRRYLAGEVTAREIGRVDLDTLQERMANARRRVAFVVAARVEHLEEEAALRARLTRAAAREAFSEFAEMERRVLRASAELLDAVRERRALLDGLDARGFHSVGLHLYSQLSEALGESDPVRRTFASVHLKPGFLRPFHYGRDDVRDYLSTASRALGESLHEVH